MNPRRLHPGFTLLEVLVALAVAAAIVVLLAQSLHIGFRARSTALEGNDTARAARLTLDAVGRDLAGALPPGGVMAGSFQSADVTFDINRPLSEVSFFNAADPLRPADAAGDVQQVSLSVVPPADVQRDPTKPSLNINSANGSAGTTSLVSGVLVRSVNRQLLASIAQTPIDQVLCENVVSFKLLYFDGSSWTDSWDSTAQGGVLPKAVQATLEIAGDNPGDRNASTYALTRIFRITCSDPNSTASRDTTAMAGPVGGGVLP